MFPSEEAGLFQEHRVTSKRVFFRRSYLKANEVKMKGQGKFNMHIVILNCADAICQLSKISPCLLKLQLARLFETL